MLYAPPERYIAEDLPHHTAAVSSKEQHVREVGLHWHDFYELVFVTGGEAVHQVNDTWAPLRAGTAFLLTPADFHRIRAVSDEPLAYYNVVVEPWLLEQRLAAIDRSITEATWTVEDAGDLATDFRRLHHESTRTDRGSAGMREAILQCILLECARRRGPGPSGGPSHPSVDLVDMRRAVLYVDHHFREPLSLPAIAGRAHLSPNYFSERFRKFTGQSFQAYLQRRRLHFARSLLTSTGLGVTNVCHAAGFNNLSHFGRAYRRRYGEPPSTTRARSRAVVRC